jgi:hypothetical protein
MKATTIRISTRKLEKGIYFVMSVLEVDKGEVQTHYGIEFLRIDVSNQKTHIRHESFWMILQEFCKNILSNLTFSSRIEIMTLF